MTQPYEDIVQVRSAAGNHFYMAGGCYKPGTIQTTNRSAYAPL